MMVFVAIDSETDTYPFGEVRLLWSPEALANLQPEIDRAELWARGVGHAHCRRLVERFRNGSRAHRAISSTTPIFDLQPINA